MNKPVGFEEVLGGYGAQLFDSWSGEPVSWGFKITKRIDDDAKWNELKKHGKLECNHGYPSSWFLIVKELTVDEAVAKYGEITSMVVGPRGGFRTVTYGDKTFCSRTVEPEEVDESLIKVER